MNLGKHQRSTDCLARAESITSRLKAAKSLKEMAIEVSKNLLSQISRPETVYLSVKDPLSHLNLPNLAKKSDMHEGCSIQVPRRLLGEIKLENLLAELIADHVTAQPTPGAKKKDRSPPFAFVVAALSTLAGHYEPGHDMTRICEAAREEAAELAAAAAFLSKADIRYPQQALNPQTGEQ